MTQTIKVIPINSKNENCRCGICQEVKVALDASTIRLEKIRQELIQAQKMAIALQSNSK